MNDNPTKAKEQYALGRKYNDGEGVPRDPEKAIFWLTKAAEQGHRGAQYDLGEKYFNGGDVPKDLSKARYWITKAAEQGHVGAMAYFYMERLVHEEDEKNSSYWQRKAAWRGDSFAKLLEKTAHSADFGCYIATCVYGSYDCPEVWTLRRYRDGKLSASWFGKRFIQIYYSISPKVVELFGNKKWFNSLWKPILNKFVHNLQNIGIDSSPYSDV